MEEWEIELMDEKILELATNISSLFNKKTQEKED